MLAFGSRRLRHAKPDLNGAFPSNDWCVTFSVHSIMPAALANGRSACSFSASGAGRVNDRRFSMMIASRI